MSASQAALAWAEDFSAQYELAAARNRKRRIERRLRRRARAPDFDQELVRAKQRLETRYAAAKATAEAVPYFAEKAKRGQWQFMSFPRWIEVRARDGDPDARRLWRAENAEYWKTEYRSRQNDLNAAISRRLQIGFEWPGGTVGGNSAYVRNGFTYLGLVSDEHPLLRLFVTRVRRRKYLRTGHTKAESNGAQSKLLALDDAYIETNPIMRGVLRVELDKDFPSWAGLGDAIAGAGAPLPNLAVGYVDPNGRVHRPHLLWLIKAPVPFTPKGRKPHQSLLVGVLKALTVALAPIGSDPGGLTNPHRHKNPLSPLWFHRIFAEEPHTLDKLRNGLCAVCPVGEAPGRLKVSPGRRTAAVHIDHSDLAVAAESNQLFSAVSILARSRVGWHRDEGHGSREQLAIELKEEARRLAPWARWTLAAVSRVHHMAQSIASWTWDKWRIRKSQQLTPSQRQRARAAAGRRTALIRSSATFEHLLAVARGLQASGQTVTQAVLSQAARNKTSQAGRTGCSLRTVRKYWKAILTELAPANARPAIRSPLDKKKCNRSPASNGACPVG
jgi:hypothetical protein